MNKPTCSLPACERSKYARGYCRIHYTRFMKHGDPSVDLHRVQHTESGLRICKGCGDEKPPTEFHRDGRSPDGYRAQCKPCRNSYMAGYYLTVAEDRMAYEQMRRTERGDHMRALDRARYERNREKRIELACEHVKIRRARMADVVTDKRVTVASLRKRDGDLCCYCDVAMSFQRGTRGEGIAPNRATLEHVMPISRGGSHTFENTALACHRCNVSKNNKTVDEWKGARHGGKEAVASSNAG